MALAARAEQPAFGDHPVQRNDAKAEQPSRNGAADIADTVGGDRRTQRQGSLVGHERDMRLKRQRYKGLG